MKSLITAGCALAAVALLTLPGHAQTDPSSLPKTNLKVSGGYLV